MTLEEFNQRLRETRGTNVRMGAVLVPKLAAPSAPAPPPPAPEISYNEAKAEYGGVIPISFGTRRMPGQLIWASQVYGVEPDLYINLGVSFGYNGDGSPEDTEITKLWANGSRIYTHGTKNLPGDWEVTLYSGTETQLPEPMYISAVGAENAPAYRNQLLAFISKLPLKQFNYQIPGISAEVSGGGEMTDEILHYSAAGPYDEGTGTYGGPYPDMAADVRAIQPVGFNWDEDRLYYHSFSDGQYFYTVKISDGTLISRNGPIDVTPAYAPGVTMIGPYFGKQDYVPTMDLVIGWYEESGTSVPRLAAQDVPSGAYVADLEEGESSHGYDGVSSGNNRLGPSITFEFGEQTFNASLSWNAGTGTADAYVLKIYEYDGGTFQHPARETSAALFGGTLVSHKPTYDTASLGLHSGLILGETSATQQDLYFFCKSGTGTNHRLVRARCTLSSFVLSVSYAVIANFDPGFVVAPLGFGYDKENGGIFLHYIERSLASTSSTDPDWQNTATTSHMIKWTDAGAVDWEVHNIPAYGFTTSVYSSGSNSIYWGTAGNWHRVGGTYLFANKVALDRTGSTKLFPFVGVNLATGAITEYEPPNDTVFVGPAESDATTLFWAFNTLDGEPIGVVPPTSNETLVSGTGDDGHWTGHTVIPGSGGSVSTLTLVTFLETVATYAGLESSTDLSFDPAITDVITGAILTEETNFEDIAKRLGRAYGFDMFESDKISFVRPVNGSSYSIDATIPVEDLENQGDRAVTTTRGEDNSPVQLALNYIDQTQQFKYNTQRARRILYPVRTTQSRRRDGFSIPIVMTASKALTLASRAIFREADQNVTHTFCLPAEYIYIQPGDILDITAGDTSYEVKVTRVEHGPDWSVAIEAVNLFADEDIEVEGESGTPLEPWLGEISEGQEFAISITPASIPINGAVINPVFDFGDEYSITITPASLPIVGSSVATSYSSTTEVTFNPSDKHADNTLSNGDLTSTNAGTSGYRGVRATVSQSSGKWVFEVTFHANGSGGAGDGIGLSNATGTLTQYLGQQVGGQTLGLNSNGNIWHQAGGSGNYTSWVSGSVVMCAVDFGNNKVWFKKHGGDWNNTIGDDPATNTGGYTYNTNIEPAFPAYIPQSANHSVTANFGQSAFSNTIPSGFTSWDGSQSGGNQVVSLNPADKHADITLSNGNLTATGTITTNYRTVRATVARSSGKYAFTFDPGPITSGEAANTAVGLAAGVFNLALNTWLGNSSGGSYSVGWYADGSVYRSGSAQKAANAVIDYNTASTLCTVAVDLDAKQLWVREGAGNWNNDASADPATGTNGIDLSPLAHTWSDGLFPAVSISNTNDAFTMNFGASAMTLPSDFSSWDGSQTGPDTFFSNVVLLTSLDGVDGATSATDDSNSAHTLNFVSTAQLDTAQSKFGTASLLPGTNYVSIPESDDFAFGSGDYTVECWVRFPSVPTTNQVILARTTIAVDDWYLFWHHSAGALTFTLHDTGGTARAAPAASMSAPAANVWHHVAATSSGNTFRVFWNGELKASVDHSGANGTIRDTAGALMLIGYPGFTGWIDEVRITKGVARYTATFTPPSAPFPRS